MAISAILVSALLVTVNFRLSVLPGIIYAPYTIILLVNFHVKGEYLLIGPYHLRNDTYMTSALGGEGVSPKHDDNRIVV